MMEDPMAVAIGRLEQIAFELGVSVVQCKLATYFVYQKDLPEAEQSENVAFVVAPGPVRPAFEKRSAETGLRWIVNFSGFFSGGDFLTLENLVNAKTKLADIVQAKAGECMVVNFWASWCSRCQAVRLVCINIDEEFETARKAIVDRGWEELEHYWLPGGWKSEAYKGLCITSLPFVVLVDGKQKIVNARPSEQVNLEMAIESLLKGESTSAPAGEKESKPTLPQTKDPFFTYAEAKSAIQQFRTEHQKEISEASDFSLTLRQQRTYTHPDKLTPLHMNMEARIEHTKLRKESALTLGQRLMDLFAQRIEVRVSTELVPYVVLPISSDGPMANYKALAIDRLGNVAVISAAGEEAGEGLLLSTGDLTLELKEKDEKKLRVDGKLVGRTFSGLLEKGTKIQDLKFDIVLPIWKGYFMEAAKIPAEVLLDFGAAVPCGLGYNADGVSIWVGRRVDEKTFDFDKFYLKKRPIAYRGELKEGDTVFEGYYWGVCQFSFCKSS